MSLLDGIRAGRVHDSGRIAFGPDRRLYVSTGDAGEPALAQDPASLNGKLLALTPAQYRGAGHAARRSSLAGSATRQGFDWQPGSGRLVATEHGPSGFDGPEGYDEVNEIVPGGNYGWPQAIGDDTGGGRFTRAAARVPRADRAVRRDVRDPARLALDGRLPVRRAARRRSCAGLELRDGRVVARPAAAVRDGYGRLRTVVEGPDGCLYVLTSNRDGRGVPDRGRRPHPAATASRRAALPASLSVPRGEPGAVSAVTPSRRPDWLREPIRSRTARVRRTYKRELQHGPCHDR